LLQLSLAAFQTGSGSPEGNGSDLVAGFRSGYTLAFAI